MNKYINVLSLAIIQGGNALLPLIIFPYLFSNISSKDFSILMYVDAISLIILSICLYGFDIKGIINSEILNKENRAKYNFEVLWIRFILWLFLYVILIFFSYYVDKTYLYIFIIWLIIPLSYCLQCNYIYLYLQCNYILAMLIFARSIFILYFTLFVEFEFLQVMTLISSLYLVTSLLSVFYLVFIKELNFFKVSIRSLKNNMVDAFHLFLGNFSVSLFRGSNVIVLGILGQQDVIGIYGLAERFVKSLQAVSKPLTDFYTSVITKEIALEKENVGEITKKVFININSIMILIILTISLFLIIIDKVNLYDPDIIIIGVILLVAIPFGIGNYLYGTLGFNLLSKSKLYSKYILIVGIISLILSFILSFLFSGFGAAISFTLAEILLFTLFYKGVKNAH
jgi:PST family polysaccharide transporter